MGPEKKLKVNLGNNEMFPSISEAYNVPVVPGQKKKRRRKKKKPSDFCIPRLKLKLINIGEQVQEELLKQKTKKSAKSKNSLLNQVEEPKSKKIHLRPTKGANFRYKMNYEGTIEKRELKKRKLSKLKRSQTNFASYLEFKQTSDKIPENPDPKNDDKIINEFAEAENSPKDDSQSNPSEPENQMCDPDPDQDTQSCQDRDLNDLIHTFTEIDHQNYYSSMNYKVKTMFLNLTEVRPNYSNTVLVREWVNHTLCDEMDISVLNLVNN